MRHVVAGPIETVVRPSTAAFPGRKHRYPHERAKRSNRLHRNSRQTTCVLKPEKAALCWDLNGEQLFRELWLPVLSAVFVRVRDVLVNEAEDIAIQAIDIAARHDPPIGSVEELRCVAVSVAKNMAVSRLRAFFAAKRGAAITISLDAPGVEATGCLSDGTGCAVATIDRAHLRELLGRLQGRLNPRMRLVVEEHYDGGLTQVEIAAKHGIPLGTVAVTMKRAMTVLRREALTGPHAEPMQEHL